MKLDEKRLQKTGVIVLLAILANFLWGSAAPCIKTGYQLFQIPSEETATQILFAGCRFTLAGILGVFLGSFLNGSFLKPTKKALPKVAVLAMLQTVIQYGFYYIGLAHTTGVKASIVTASNVFIGILIASLLFRQEKLTPQKILGCLIGFAGVVVVNVSSGTDLNLQMSLAGEGCIFMAAVAYSFSYVTMKLFSASEDPIMLSNYQFVLGGVIMIAIGFLSGGRITVVTGQGILMLIYLAMVSAVAYSVWSLLLKYNPVSRVTVFGFMNPVFGVLLSALLLGESGQAFGARGLIALVLVCIGIYIVNRGKPAGRV
ncbi:MAG: DMT family transporter [Lachnospiraceae bacterium]|nr:DMT family transporter [Lachnospiraceae bacterium]